MFFLSFHRKDPSRGHSINPPDVMDFLMPFAAPDKSGFFENDQALLVQCVTWNTASSRLEPAPLHYPAAKIHIASWARIDNRQELAGKLDLSLTEIERLCDSELICRSYLKWQEDCVHHLIGDFVFALYDEKARKVFCGRDHMGVRPFYYYLSDDRFVCATSLSPLIHIKDLPVHISRRWIVDYLTHLSMSFEETPYIGIKKLPPAHTLTVTPERHHLRQYFTLGAEPELKAADSREYVDAYREQLETAVKCRLNTTYPLGSELSGGLDSSTITAYAAKYFDQPLTRLHVFAFATLEMEPQYILSVSQACGLPHTHVVAGRHLDQDKVLDRSLKVLGYPVEHGNATFHEPFYQMAETFNVRTLLSGFGGDEFGTTIHGYMVPMEMTLQSRYRALLGILPGRPVFRFLRLARLYLRKIKTRDFTRPEYNPRFYQAWMKRWPHQPVADDMAQTYDLKKRYFDTARFDAGYTDLKRFTLEKRWMPFVPTRMENCTLMAAARNVEYRWPLLDVRLVRLFLHIPSEENYFRGMGRYLHRQAADGVVPDLVLWKRGKYMGNPARDDAMGQADMDTAFVAHLHPGLKEVLDMEKLAGQAARTARCATGHVNDFLFQLRRNLWTVKQLDYWLKRCPAEISEP